MPSEKEIHTALDVFGRLVAEDLRDAAIDAVQSLIDGRLKAPGVLKLQAIVARMSADDQATLLRCVLFALDVGIHDFLFKLEEQADRDRRIVLLVDGIDIVEAGDGLHSEMMLDSGWFGRYSRHGPPRDES